MKKQIMITTIALSVSQIIFTMEDQSIESIRYAALQAAADEVHQELEEAQRKYQALLDEDSQPSTINSYSISSSKTSNLEISPSLQTEMKNIEYNAKKAVAAKLKKETNEKMQRYLENRKK